MMDKAKQGSASAVATGLRGVVAASSSIGDVNGEKGELIYQGLNIHDLATKSTFEEVVFLLWNGRLPKRAELDDLKKNLAASYALPWQIVELIKGMYARVPANDQPMDALRAVIAALGALSGPLHGGANTAVMKMLLEIGSLDRVESFVRQALANKRKIMGWGHAVYRTDDQRATHLRQLSKEMGERKGDTKWYDMTAKVEEVMKREKGLLPNVDAYSASTYYMMGIPLDLYTPIFAISRISGWTAHILEQYANNKLIRPRAEYIGPRNVPYVPIDER